MFKLENTQVVLASVRQWGNTKLTQIWVSIVSVAYSGGAAGKRWFARSFRVFGVAECGFAGAHCCSRQLVGATNVATFYCANCECRVCAESGSRGELEEGCNVTNGHLKPDLKFPLLLWHMHMCACLCKYLY